MSLFHSFPIQRNPNQDGFVLNWQRANPSHAPITSNVSKPLYLVYKGVKWKQTFLLRLNFCLFLMVFSSWWCSASILLEEIVGCSSRNVGFTAPGSRVELQEGVLQCVVQFHYGCLVSTAVTVIWSREYCYHISVVTPIVSLHDELMCARDESKSVGVIERLRDVLAERVASTSWRNAPTSTVIGIWP